MSVDYVRVSFVIPLLKAISSVVLFDLPNAVLVFRCVSDNRDKNMERVQLASKVRSHVRVIL